MLYKSINTPWVLVNRADGRELWRGDEEPTREALKVLYSCWLSCLCDWKGYGIDE